MRSAKRVTSVRSLSMSASGLVHDETAETDGAATSMTL